jgi:hypothetical protein
MSALTKIASMTEVTRRLGDLVAEENEILKSRRPRELANHQDEKNRLTSTYEQQLTDLKRDPGLLRGMAPDVLSSLKAATRHFQVQLEEHRRMVQAAKSVTERMLNAIVRNAGEGHKTVEAYDRGAVMRPAFAEPRRAMPLALDTVV